MLAECAGAVVARDPGELGSLRTVLWRLWAGEPLDPASLHSAALHSYRVGDYERTRELAEAAWNGHHSFEAGHLLGFALATQVAQIADGLSAA